MTTDQNECPACAREGRLGIRIYAQGVCNKHYQRLQKYGTTDLPKRRYAKDQACVNHPDRSAKQWADETKTDAWCGSCYDRWKLHGDPLHVERLRGGTDGDRIERWVDRSGGPDACWPWTGAINYTNGEGGYGLVRGGRSGYAHVVAYRELVGPIPEGMELDHVCHNRDLDCDPSKCLHRRCCNPAHLEVVTKQENMARQFERTAAVHRKRADDERRA